ncbi:MAG: hypothetical protein CBC48_08210 [bacterium TMED88]|nr:hypothetical protein [Deltaproteobacteria bacterium]OUV32574.1 MAG: hypothetical protein CBC48_08210 [bacterium TMED88]
MNAQIAEVLKPEDRQQFSAQFGPMTQGPDVDASRPIERTKLTAKFSAPTEALPSFPVNSFSPSQTAE